MKTDQLEKLGFKKAADSIKQKQELKRKMVIAYEHFRYVRQEKIDNYCKKLKAGTLKEQGQQGRDLVQTYDTLVFIKPQDYDTVPPQDVLNKIEEAQKLECFDELEICKVESVKEYQDPIVFGRINGCPDRFFITQWDNDVKIEDILKDNEG